MYVNILFENNLIQNKLKTVLIVIVFFTKVNLFPIQFCNEFSVCLDNTFCCKEQIDYQSFFKKTTFFLLNRYVISLPFKLD